MNSSCMAAHHAPYQIPYLTGAPFGYEVVHTATSLGRAWRRGDLQNVKADTGGAIGGFPAREYQNSCGHGPCRRREPYLLTYLHRPLAYGALGLIDFTRDLRIKESLSFTPSQ